MWFALEGFYSFFGNYQVIIIFVLVMCLQQHAFNSLFETARNMQTSHNMCFPIFKENVCVWAVACSVVGDFIVPNVMLYNTFITVWLMVFLCAVLSYTAQTQIENDVFISIFISVQRNRQIIVCIAIIKCAVYGLPKNNHKTLNVEYKLLFALCMMCSFFLCELYENMY